MFRGGGTKKFILRKMLDRTDIEKNSLTQHLGQGWREKPLFTENAKQGWYKKTL